MGGEMSGGSRPVRIVAVGQTPPPFGGQADTLELFVTARYRLLEVFHVRMAFSRDTADIGRPRPGKVLHLVGLIARTLWRRARTGATVLYYPPAGADLVPVLRDLAVLLCTRWAFRATAFHFHAAGVSAIEPRLPRPLRPLFRAAYGGADLAIQTSALNPPDGLRLGARRVVVVPSGIPDHPLAQQPRESSRTGPPVLLYVGVLRESKGLLVLVAACERLRQRGVDFRLHLMGAFESSEFEATLRAAIADAGLRDQTVFLGSRAGEEKWECFRASDIFCYPTHFEVESFGLVCVEAMRFSLPVIATRWRGVPSVVAEGESGLLVPVRDPAQLEAALATLIEDPELRRRMGARGRELYVERFTDERFRREMEAVLCEL
jgi:glycosyltransferase involved in cell wall biosynthesis